MSAKRKIEINAIQKCSLTEREAQKALKEKFENLLATHFIPSFERAKTGHRIMAVLQGMLAMGVGRRTLTNSIIARGLEQNDWSADYRAFAVGKWDPVALFAGVFKAAVPLLGQDGSVVLGIDDTGLPKTGTEIEFTDWIHNPLVPKYVRPAIQWGVPVFHAALLIQGETVHRPTAITVAFEPIMREKKKRKRKRKDVDSGNTGPTTEIAHAVLPPKRRGRPTKEESAHKKAERDAHIREEEQGHAQDTLHDVRLKATELAVRVIWRVRKWMDAAGMTERQLVVVGDSSYTNGTVMLNLPHHTIYLGRTRPDTRLQAVGSTKTGKIKYGPFLPPPKEMAVGHLLEVKVGDFHYAGALRRLKYLELGPVFRKTSTKKMLLKLLVLEPVPYQGPSRSSPRSDIHPKLLTGGRRISHKGLTRCNSKQSTSSESLMANRS